MSKLKIVISKQEKEIHKLGKDILLTVSTIKDQNNDMLRILKILEEMKNIENWEELLGGAPDKELVEEEEEEAEEEKVVEEEEEDNGDDSSDSAGDGAGDGDGDDAGSNGDSYDGGNGNGNGGGGSDLDWFESNNEKSESEDDTEQCTPEYEKDGIDEKIEYETVDGKKVEADFSMDRSKWFRPIKPILEHLVQNIKVKKTEDTNKIIS
ncbi:hypothetical protein L1987_20846 [Smallanthus sonchifolius]|uniref:Uncharacterized protein n=1 Tax=Smallanthus sonchifolius TaxID=185202 RepID=A0ACB9IT73_9ASTR|nr:hypothetical protein L1987_20846 [Smallanthus sonchifolius]